MTDHERDRNDPAPAEDAHPIAQPSELAGTADGAIEAEFAARDALEAGQADAQAEDSPPA